MAKAITSQQDHLCQSLHGAAKQIIEHATEVVRHFDDRQQLEHREDAGRVLDAGRDLQVFVRDLAQMLERGESFASLRHDIRNTVGLVSGYAEILEDEVAHPSPAMNDLKAILKHTEHFLATLDALSALDTELSADSSPVEDLINSLNATAASRTEATFGRKVLLVDDNDSNRELVGLQLNRLGIEVAEARTGNEALAALATKSIDLVLLDLILPDINGYDLLRRIKQDKNWRHLAIIIISGVKDEQSALRCLEAGASDYIVKPVNATLLRARVGALLERKVWEDKESAYLSNLEASYDFIRKVFGRYLSNDVMQRLLYDGDGLTLGGERREVSILLADIRSFSVISQQISPEDCVRLLNNYFAVMTDIIMSYQGTVDEFIGDGILAIFGAPVNDELHSDHAVACALEMQRAVPMVNAFNRENGLPDIDIGIGINSGAVVVGNVGSELRTKYGVVGHNVNIASRIESCTVGGQVLASAETLQHMRATAQWRKMLEVDVKGASDPLKIYDLTAIGEPYSISLPNAERELVPTTTPVELEVRLLQGERLSQNVGTGLLVAFNGRDLLIELDLTLCALEEVQLCLPSVGEESIAYARVMGMDEQQRYHVTLTSSIGKMRSLLDQYREKSP
ncbi:adenylate/guanylate cyclase domain-containing protein [Litorivivens sp.]|uniref:adenylate/guanylate cyclase domain-containing protein n=1 Tax=Litorivivens sp. TaxID=2020868 RepID=UPI00356B4221